MTDVLILRRAYLDWLASGDEDATIGDLTNAALSIQEAIALGVPDTTEPRPHFDPVALRESKRPKPYIIAGG